MDWLLFPIQIVLMLAVAPLLQGVIKTSKARWQSRTGPGILQPYRDIAKFLARESVVSEHASWIFRVAPPIYAASVICAAVLVPTVAHRSAAPAVGDAILLVGLLALGRFFLALAALDTGSNFGGMGASREVTFAALVEPALFLVIFAVALPRGSTNLSALVGDGAIGVAGGLALLALLIAVITETGRIPIDNPDTHLELTMAHEGMILEYSGRPLGVIHWAAMIKQMALLGLIAAFFLPWGMAPASGAGPGELAVGIAAFLAKVTVLGLLLGMIETSIAKLRIFRAPDLIGFASLLGILAVLATTLAGN